MSDRQILEAVLRNIHEQRKEIRSLTDQVAALCAANDFEVDVLRELAEIFGEHKKPLNGVNEHGDIAVV